MGQAPRSEYRDRVDQITRQVTMDVREAQEAAKRGGQMLAAGAAQLGHLTDHIIMDALGAEVPQA